MVQRGAESDLPFEAAAIQTISSASRGLPRLVNALCDNALMVAFGSGDAWVTPVHVAQAICDLDLKPADEVSPAAKMNGSIKSLQPQAAPQEAAAPEPSNGTVAAETLHLPPPAPVMSLPLGLRTLEQYLPSERKVPFLMRCAGKLGFVTVERQVRE